MAEPTYEPWQAFPSTTTGNAWYCWVGHKWPELNCGQVHHSKAVADDCAATWARKVNQERKFTCDPIAHNPLTHFIVPSGHLRARG